jgi:Tol biopolymer transport system component
MPCEIMPLTIGSQLGSHEITALLGKGGMGEVYRARDLKLKRDVALKVLPEVFSGDAGRLVRFEYEAEVLASLNHPNIAHIYGVEERALVMELVEGESPKGPLPFEEAWKIALQIAQALEYAHDKGIVHRDLKPANIKVTPEGVVKLLDFGLAKAFDVGAASDSEDPANSPTMTLGATAAGAILGTAAYMAPEQARGRPVDKRADIWAFGIVLYELLTGEPLFRGDDASEILATIIKDEPDLSKVPPNVRRILNACLEKDPKKRLRDIGDVSRLIGENGAETPGAAKVHSTVKEKLAWTVAVVGLILAIGTAYFWHRESANLPEPQVLRYTLTLPERTGLTSFAVSPDGRYLAIAATGEPGAVLGIRAMDSLQIQTLPGTEGAAFPFWSPDGRFVAFFTQDKLKKVAVTGGPPQTLCDAPNSRGGAWNRDGVIIFAPDNGGRLDRVPAAGGIPVEINKTEQGNFRFPMFLPDGRRFLFTYRGGKEPGVYIGSLDSRDIRRLTLDQSNAMYAPPSGSGRPGHVLFVREQTLMAQPVDPATIQAAGDVFPVVEHVAPQGTVTLNQYSLSANGILIYQTGTMGQSVQLTWFDRAGKQVGTVGSPALVRDFALSPDAKRVLIERPQGEGSDLWMLDIEHGVESRFTFDASTNRYPVWSPDGSRIVFASSRVTPNALFEKASNMVGQERQLIPLDVSVHPYDWSRDGKFLVFTGLASKTGDDLFAYPFTNGPENADDRKPIPLLQTAAWEWMGQVSPDGRWLAYISDETTRTEVYVQPFVPGSKNTVSGKWQISSGGGNEPRWSADGKELFFVAAGDLMATTVKATGGTFERSTPQRLFDTHFLSVGGTALGRPTVYHYAPSPDGKRFLLATQPGNLKETAPLTVLVNWQVAVKK